MEVYSYKPLQGESAFRLLYLQAGSGTSISIQLQHHSLDAHPSYEALSYTWHTPEYEGLHKEIIVDDKRTQWVECDNRRIFITPNCEAALLQLRRPDTTRILWVDAICIDQANIPERNEQVLLMQTIYSQCTGALCWIGKGEDYVLTLFGYIESFVNQAKEIERLSQLPQDELTKQQYSMVMLAFKEIRSATCGSVKDAERTPLFSAMSSLHRRSYWDRIWVLQEIRAAVRRTIVCGEAQIDYHDIEFFLLADYRLDVQAEKRGSDERSWIGGLLYRFMAQMSVVDEDNSVSALETIRWGVPFLATDPKDKVFALIGLSDQLRDLVPKPDYSQTTDQVYTNIAAAILDRMKTLDLLYYCFGQACEPNLPSWVPDWSSAERPWWKPQFEAAQRFQATKGTVPYLEMQQSNKNQSLKVKGLIVDTMDSVAEYYREQTLESAKSLRRDQPRDTWAQSSDAANFFLTYPYDIWRQWCMMAAQCSSQPWTAGSAADADPLWFLFDAVLSQPELHHGYEVWREILEHEDLVPAMRAQYIAMIDKVNEFDRATRVFAGLTLCTTTAKRLALAPHAVQAGDKVALIAGCSLPFAVRPIAKGYKLIGASYVHDLMHGEAIADREDQLVTIVLTGLTDVDEMAKWTPETT